MAYWLGKQAKKKDLRLLLEVFILIMPAILLSRFKKCNIHLYIF